MTVTVQAGIIGASFEQ